MNKLEIKKLNKIFLNNDVEKTIFKNMNLEINLNEITVILGKSGCGKTTFLRLISSLDTEYTGEINFLKNNEKFPCKQSFVFQEPRLMPWLNVEENIKIHDVKNKLITENINELLTLLKIEGINKMYPNEISGGMASRVSIARALSYFPDVILMDEPFNSLDYFTRNSLQKMIIEIFQKTKKGIVFITHNIEEALAIANRILVFTNNNYEEFIIKENYPRKIEDKSLQDIKEKILETLDIV